MLFLEAYNLHLQPTVHLTLIPKEIRIYIETIEQGKKERAELKDQLKNQEKRRRTGKKKRKHSRKELVKWRMQVSNICHIVIIKIVIAVLLVYDKIN